jgi:hypothetical protein
VVGFFEGCESNVQFWQAVQDLRRLKAHVADTQEEFEGVLGIAHGFGGPEVGVVKDADDGICFDGLEDYLPGIFSSFPVS